jgi:hypothetical protein
LSRRREKIKKAHTAFEDEKIKQRLSAEFGDKYNEAYVKEAVGILQNELNKNKTLIGEEPPKPQGQG